MLALLRAERHALSALGATAMLLRVVFSVLGLAMMPMAGATASPLTGLVVCSGTTGSTKPVNGTPLSAFGCPCTACHHTGCTTAYPLPAADALSKLPAVFAAMPRLLPVITPRWQFSKDGRIRIRAPPRV